MSEDPTDAGEGVEYDPETETYTATFDGRPSRAVVDLMAEVAGDPFALDPLYHVLDADALDRLLAHRATSRAQGDLTIAFDYHGYRVTVHSFGVVRVGPAAEGERGCEPVDG